MLAVLSPAKNMVSVPSDPLTVPQYQGRADFLTSQLQELSPWQLESVLRTNPDIALRAFSYYQNNFSGGMDGCFPALLGFRGLCYQHLNALDFTGDDLLYAQDHLRILSALYGILRPLDGIRLHRLEMVSRLKVEGKNLYAYWGDRIYQAAFARGEAVINLASHEYEKLILPFVQSRDRFITCRFLCTRRRKLVTLPTEAKAARGEMARFLVKNRLDSPEQLQEFSWNGYHYVPHASSPECLVFIQEAKSP